MRTTIFPPRSILFPVDFSERCRGAGRQVETFTGHFQARLTMLHVAPAFATSMPLETRDGASVRLEAFLAEELKHFDVERQVLEGDAAQAIIDYANSRPFDLVMMATHGYGPFRRLILGSTAGRVLRGVECPVWTSAHGEETPPLEAIAYRSVACLAPRDGSGSAAISWASQFARETGARLTLIHALAAGGDEESAETAEVRAEEARREVANMQELMNVRAGILVAAGTDTAAIHDAVLSVGADLLVACRAAEGEGRQPAIEELVRTAPCPVLSV